ncbi:MAG: dihydromonapterin reductase [Gammaproteobacteria bacterium]|nr:dihydromonapterin reductase [Gammaproteobacteria bacterium]
MSAPIIITGGGQRLGLATALHFAKNKQPVVITFRNNTKNIPELERAGVECIQVDFATPSSINYFIKDIESRYSQIRGIIHNASDWVPESNADDPAGLFDRMMFIHAKVPYLINRSLSKQLIANADATGRPSDIIHMTDFVIEKGSRKHLAYAASKAALNSLTKSFAAQLAPQVKVNEIAPALLMFNQDDDQEYRTKALKKSLMQCAPGEQEGVKAIEFLLNSDYMTGRILHLDGGRHLV